MKPPGRPKRTAGLSRTTRMRSGKPLQRSARMRARSEKMEATYDERRPLVEHLLRVRPRCEIRVRCDGAPSVDVHEVLTRGRGGSIIDADNCLTACRTCHTWVTDHPAESNCLGYTVPSWAENVVDDPMATAAELRATRAPCPWFTPSGACPSPCAPQNMACRAR